MKTKHLFLMVLLFSIFMISLVSAYDWNFSISSDYTYNSSQINVSDGNAQLVPQIVSSTNTGWWHLNEASGTIAVDSSGNSNNGTLTGSQNWIAGKLNNAFNFTTSSNYFDVNKVYGFTNAMTLSAWVNFNSVSTTQGIVDNWAGGSGTFLLYLSSGNLVFDCGNATTEKATAGYSLSAGNWYYIVGTYDGNLMKLYVNGVNVRNQTLGGNLATSVRHFWIGRYSASNMNGTIDEVYIADRVLEQSEINARYNAGVGTEAIGTYSTNYFTIQPKNNFSYVGTLGNFSEISIKTGSSVSYCISNDSVNYKYWDGANWVSSSCNNVQVNNASVINSNIGTFASSGNFTFKALLSSNDGTFTPFLDNVFAYYPPPNITFTSQNPADINSLNLYNSFGLNINYNISSSAGINTLTTKMFFKTNSSSSDVTNYINGTSSVGYFNELGSNQSVNWTFNLDDNDIYPAIFTLNQGIVEDTVHNIFPINALYSIKTEFFNVSNFTQYNIFEFMVNSTITPSPTTLFAYYCNSSYVSGDVTTTPSVCFNFGTISAIGIYNITNPDLNSSMYQYLPFAINITSGTIGTIKVTSQSYFILRKGTGATVWNAYYTNLTARSSTTQTSLNNGALWSSQNYTFDMHLHQYNGISNTFYYYVCANDSSNFQICSNVRSDLLDLGGLPPNSPNIYHPINSIYHDGLSINYTASLSPNGYAVNFYNITLLNQSSAFNKTIITNNSNNLNYLYNSSLASDGFYIIKVTSCDVNGLCSDGFSQIFGIDNTAPFGDLVDPLNNTITDIFTHNFTINAFDNGTLGNLTLNIYNDSGSLINQTTITTNETSGLFGIVYTFLTNGIYHWFYTIYDTAGNFFQTMSRMIHIISIPTVIISYPNNSNYTYSVGHFDYSISYADYCWYSLDNGLVNISTPCGSYSITGILSTNGINIWTVSGNNSINNVTSAQVIFNSTCSNIVPVVDVVSYPYVDVNSSYQIKISSFPVGNSNIKMILNGTVFNFVYDNISSYVLNFVFSSLGDYSFIIYGDNICPSINQNITGTFKVRHPFYITIAGFTNKSTNFFTSNEYKNDFAYIIAEDISQNKYHSLGFNDNLETFVTPLLFSKTFKSKVFYAPYTNGVATLKLYEPNTTYALRLIDGDIAFPSTYSVPNITTSYGTNIYLGQKYLNGTSQGLNVLLTDKDIHPYRWLFNVIFIISVLGIIVISIFLFFLLPTMPWISLIFGLGGTIMFVIARIVIWFWLG